MPRRSNPCAGCGHDALCHLSEHPFKTVLACSCDRRHTHPLRLLDPICKAFKSAQTGLPAGGEK